MGQFTEEKLEQAIIALLEVQGYAHYKGESISRQSNEVLIKADLHAFFSHQYASDKITESEIESIIRRLEVLNPADLYDSNKTICKLASDGFLLKREDRSQKDLYIQLIDYAGLPEQRVPRKGEVEMIVAEESSAYGRESNIYRFVNQLEIEGLFDKHRLRQVIRHFIYFPDVAKQQVKVVCRYPQYYAAIKLYQNILQHRKPEGDGKGGTYFGATGCGKSFAMLFLTRLLMKSIDFESPTIVLITDRTDLDNQLSGQFTNAKSYIGDQTVVSVESRAKLRGLLKGRNSGRVFLTTIHKFTEDTELLSERNNIICISDEAHRSQVNLDQKVRVTEKGVQRSYGFARDLHDSLPNETYVGFTGTPIDATLEVFGEVVDGLTMTESVKDEITVRIVYEGRAAKVLLDNKKLEEIEAYYAQCAR